MGVAPLIWHSANLSLSLPEREIVYYREFPGITLGAKGLRRPPQLLYSHRFVMALLQWHNVYKLGEDELPEPPWW